jgi:hypothetical protein
MSFNRIKPGGYGVGAKVTSAQFNQLDIDHSNSTADYQYYAGATSNCRAEYAWQQVSSGNAGPYAVTWDDSSIATDSVAGQRWLVAGYNTGTYYVYAMTGGDSAGVVVGGAFSTGGQPITSIAVDSSGNIYAGFPESTAAEIYKSAPPGGAFGAFASGGAGTNFTDVQVAVLGSTIVAALGNATSGNVWIGHCSGGSINVDLSPGVAVQSWILRSNGSTVLAIGKIAGASVYTSSNGTSWTTTSLSGTLGASDIPIDVVWSSVLQEWLMAVNVAGGGTTAFYTSLNGTVWTATGTTLSTSLVNSLAAFGPIWVAAAKTSSATARVLLCSADAVTWAPTTTQLYGPSTATCKLASSPTQLCAALCPPITTTTAAYSLRFSQPNATPDTAVT